MKNPIDPKELTKAQHTTIILFKTGTELSFDT